MMDDSKDEDSQCEVTRNLIDVEDGDQQDDFSEFVWNEIEAGCHSSPTEAQASSLLRRSPDPECAICLEPIEDKGVADSCFHSFCFTCLLKWSKIKAECPLCKQPFKSIMHNIRSSDDYDEYHIAPKNDRHPLDFDSELWIGRHNYRRFEDTFEYIACEMIHASSLSANFPTERNLFSGNPSTISFRKHIYENGSWVTPFRYQNVQQHRMNYAQFYRCYPQYISRIRPWLNRELFALLGDRQSQIPFLLDLILSLVTRYDMRSEEFFFHVVPYFQHRTSHFIHEFYNFACSLYEMDRYDHCALYENLVSESCCNAMPHTAECDAKPVASSSITFSESAPSVCIIYASSSSCPSGRNTAASSERQHENWHSICPVSSQSSKSTLEYTAPKFPEQNAFPGPSTLEIESRFSPESVTTVYFPAADDSDSSVGILSPSFCAPEIIDLVSSSEDENACTSTVHNSCMATQIEENSGCTFWEKEHQGEKFVRTNVDSSGEVFPSNLAELTNYRCLTPGPQFFGSPSPQNESISSSTSVYPKKMDTENDMTFRSKYVENLESLASYPVMTCSSQLLSGDRHFSFAAAAAAKALGMTCNSRKGCSPKKSLSLCSGEDLPISFSINQTSKRNESDIAISSSKDKVPEFRLNRESQSCVQNSENDQKDCSEAWECCNPSVSRSYSGESCTSKRSGDKRKLSSVVCVLTTTDQQSSNNGPSSGCHKRHKKKRGKSKHSCHHKCSHSFSDSCHHSQKCKKCKDRKKKKHKSHKHCHSPVDKDNTSEKKC